MNDVNGQRIIDYLLEQGAIRVNEHFVYTSGKHGRDYIDIRTVAHDSGWVDEMGSLLNERLSAYDFDSLLGPETLGRTFAQAASAYAPANTELVWCEFKGEGEDKKAIFSTKLNFGRLIAGKRFAIVDDLATTGSTTRQVVELVEKLGGTVVVAAFVVRRAPDITAETCNVPALEVLAEAPPGFESWTEAECKISGPCSEHEPMVSWPAHGEAWLARHENRHYPVSKRPR